MNRKAKSKSKLPIGAGQANQMTNKENHTRNSKTED